MSPVSSKAPVPYSEFVEVKKLLQIEREERDSLQQRVKELEAALESAKNSSKLQVVMAKTALEAKLTEQDATIRGLREQLEECQKMPSPSPSTSASDPSSIETQIKLNRVTEENVKLGDAMLDINRRSEAPFFPRLLRN